jgi:hypothetical protein
VAKGRIQQPGTAGRDTQPASCHGASSLHRTWKWPSKQKSIGASDSGINMWLESTGLDRPWTAGPRKAGYGRRLRRPGRRRRNAIRDSSRPR